METEQITHLFESVKINNYLPLVTKYRCVLFGLPTSKAVGSVNFRACGKRCPTGKCPDRQTGCTWNGSRLPPAPPM